jgi:hypothetical protein
VMIKTRVAAEMGPVRWSRKSCSFRLAVQAAKAPNTVYYTRSGFPYQCLRPVGCTRPAENDVSEWKEGPELRRRPGTADYKGKVGLKSPTFSSPLEAEASFTLNLSAPGFRCSLRVDYENGRRARPVESGTWTGFLPSSAIKSLYMPIMAKDCQKCSELSSFL